MLATVEFEAVNRLNRDLKEGIQSLSRDEARFLVDAYYTIQKYRIANASQVRAIAAGDDPPAEVLQWLFTQNETMENQIKRALDWWTDEHPVSVWAKSICGIGPVISAGLMAHIDIEKAPTAGHIWRFAGLDPTTKWEKKTKRPFNAALKCLTAFKLGESFVKVQNNDNDIYGKIYAARKRDEMAHNERGDFAEQAAAILEAKKFGKDTEAYKALSSGRLPQAQIHARARRYAVKLFLAHYHHKLYEHRYGIAPPLPYPIAILGHAHYMPPPN